MATISKVQYSVLQKVYAELLNGEILQLVLSMSQRTFHILTDENKWENDSVQKIKNGVQQHKSPPLS